MKLRDIYIRDPFLYVENGTGYLVGTTDAQAWGGKASGFLGYRTKDLVDFEGPFTLFERSEAFWGDENYWAPELHAYGGKYWLFASFYREGKKRASQALVSDTPFGRYAPAAVPFTPPEWHCLDATLYEENGVPYTVFCREWVDCSDGEIYVAPLGGKFDRLTEEPQLLFRASDAPWVRTHNGKDFITDAPYLYPLKSGKLLMLWSSYGKEGYALGMAVSEHGVRGPWRHIPDPLFAKNGGHGMVFRWQDKTYVMLHSPNEPHMSERAVFFEVEEKEDRLVLK